MAKEINSQEKKLSKTIIDKSKSVGKTLAKPTKIQKANISQLQRAPQTILSKEQAMLSSLFNQKNQLWGRGRPVTISNHLTSGFGLLKTGSGDATRRLMF